MRSHIAAAIVLCGCINLARAEDAPDEVPLKTLSVTPSPWKEFRLTLDGYLRVRADVFNDLDLSRGPTPTTGQPIFPTPAAGGGDHTITGIDMRLRLEPTLEVGQAVKIHMRVDVLDNLAWGSTPDVLPSTSALTAAALSQQPPRLGINSLSDAIAVKQAWGEVTLPFGVLSAGRMGALINWGTGFFVNNGSCIACDFGDTGDRIALTVPIRGHYASLLYDMSVSGPLVSTPGQMLPADRRAQVNTVALSVAKWLSPEAQRRKLRAGRTLIQYGILASYRRQDLDAPGWLLPGGLTRQFGPSEFVRRDLQSFAGDLWIMLHKGGFRAEIELATVLGRIGDSSPTPGVGFRSAVTSKQFGGVGSLSYEFRWPARLRVEVGAASGDDAPGFGNVIPQGQLTTQKGDLQGPQARPPIDTTVDNFRFNPDYHVDLILWRRIVGQVTDAVYVKPTLRLGPFGSTHHHFTLDTSAIVSNAIYSTSAPGQERYLGVELDLMARYRYELGFEINLGYGLFVPGGGFRNLDLHLEPQPAQALELILAYRI